MARERVIAQGPAMTHLPQRFTLPTKIPRQDDAKAGDLPPTPLAAHSSWIYGDFGRLWLDLRETGRQLASLRTGEGARKGN